MEDQVVLERAQAAPAEVAVVLEARGQIHLII